MYSLSRLSSIATGYASRKVEAMSQYDPDFSDPPSFSSEMLKAMRFGEQHDGPPYTHTMSGTSFNFPPAEKHTPCTFALRGYRWPWYRIYTTTVTFGDSYTDGETVTQTLIVDEGMTEQRIGLRRWINHHARRVRPQR